MRILLIDDDPDIRMLATFVLRKASHDVQVVETGAAGLEAARTTAFDLVLLDHRLGDMNGLDVLAALGDDPGTTAPVVFLTGASDMQTMQAFIDAGALDVVTKPFDPETLAARLAEIVRSADR